MMLFWRRERDSNPRYGETVRLISSQVQSTTLPSLRVSTTVFYQAVRPQGLRGALTVAFLGDTVMVTLPPPNKLPS